jgi:tRNA-splicing ligase RtcB (3'-phosphate/5'-hydroxy nucleic acid ligase)
MGLVEGNLVLMIHCGSRGLGIRSAPIMCRIFKGQPASTIFICRIGNWYARRSTHQKGKLTWRRCGRQQIMLLLTGRYLAHLARKAFEQVFAGKVKNWRLHQVYDIAHNMGKSKRIPLMGKR